MLATVLSTNCNTWFLTVISRGHVVPTRSPDLGDKDPSIRRMSGDGYSVFWRNLNLYQAAPKAAPSVTCQRRDAMYPSPQQDTSFSKMLSSARFAMVAAPAFRRLVQPSGQFQAMLSC